MYFTDMKCSQNSPSGKRSAFWCTFCGANQKSTRGRSKKKYSSPKRAVMFYLSRQGCNIWNQIYDTSICSSQENTSEYKKRSSVDVPRLQTVCVCDVVKSMRDYDGKLLGSIKGFATAENQIMNHLMMTGVKSVNDTPSNLTRAAMHCHFKTKKRTLKIKEKKMDELLQKQK